MTSKDEKKYVSLERKDFEKILKLIQTNQKFIGELLERVDSAEEKISGLEKKKEKESIGDMFA